uniref:Uncharacterized protein n=1 Tax=Cyprinus carpio TaxID=7962 RepID=A0A8C1JHH0_CYPCA
GKSIQCTYRYILKNKFHRDFLHISATVALFCFSVSQCFLTSIVEKQRRGLSNCSFFARGRINKVFECSSFKSPCSVQKQSKEKRERQSKERERDREKN